VRYLSSVPLVCLLLAGCAGSDLIVQRQGTMEGRINQMMQTQNGTSVQVAELSLQVKELKEQVAKQALAGKAAAAEIAALQEQVQRLSRRAERSEAETATSAAARIEVVNSGTGGESREEKIQSAYMRAFGLFSANNYDAAAVAFADFIASYPESEDAANARYWLGECHFAAGRYPQAIEAFAKVLDTRPSATRGADALLKTGLSWFELKDNDKGRATLRALLEKYPGSEAAARATEELAHR
jgi:tol-pal system protein YbgF